MRRTTLVLALVCFLGMSSNAWAAMYSDTILSEGSLVGYWRLGESSASLPAANAEGTVGLNGTYMNGPGVGTGGALAPYDMDTATGFNGSNQYVKINDPGVSSALDSGGGSGITLEAWVLSANIAVGQSPYIISKGRTVSGATDQNYGLQGKAISATQMAVKFLYRNSTNTGWNIWESTEYYSKLEYHHIAVSYTFGNGNSFKAYVDGQEVAGNWTLGSGNDAPIQSNDDLWIGSSMANAAGATWLGRIDEVAVYKTALSESAVQSHYEAAIPEPSMLALMGMGVFAAMKRRFK